MKKRFLFQELSNYLSHKNALVITGMRQVGKTTLMRQVFDEVNDAKIWFDFDNPLDHLLFEAKNYESIYNHLIELTGQYKKRLFVFVDEIQNYPPITKVVKYLIDHHNVKFIMTGSSNYYLKNLFPESLSGRKFLFQLNPLSFPEYMYFTDELELEISKSISLDKLEKKILAFTYESRKAAYETYVQYGGFPEVVLTKDQATKKLVLKNIFTSFFEKDIQLLSDYADIRELRDLILLLVPRVGSLMDVSRISRELGIDRVKIYRFLEFLQGTFFIRLLPRFSHSIDRSVAGGKKVYFTDTGILNSIGTVNEAQLFENAVINQLLNYGKISFFTKRNTAEIDAILEKEIAFEIKLHGTDQDKLKLSNLADEIQIPKTYLISKTYIDKPGFISPVVF